MLHFAYGANMHRAVMRRHAPTAEPIGVATLANHRFVITADGYASVASARTETVYGVLWRITPRDRAALDAWENIAGGLYVARTLPVHHQGRGRSALVYVARPCRAGRPKAGYMEIVIAAASAWNLPPGYVADLQRRMPAFPLASGARKLGEFEWT